MLVLTFSSSLIEVLEGKLKSEDEALKWFFEVDSESEVGKMKGGLFSTNEKEEVSFEVPWDVAEEKNSKELKIPLKVRDPFPFLKMVLTFLSSLNFSNDLTFFSKVGSSRVSFEV